MCTGHASLIKFLSHSYCIMHNIYHQLLSKSPRCLSRHSSCITEPQNREDKVKISLIGEDLHCKTDGFVCLFVPNTFGLVLRLKVILYCEKVLFFPHSPHFFPPLSHTVLLGGNLIYSSMTAAGADSMTSPPPTLGWEESTKLFSQSQLRQVREKQSKLYRKLERALRK